MQHDKVLKPRGKPVAHERLEPYDGAVVRYLHYLAREPYFYEVMRLLLEVTGERRKLVVRLLHELRNA